MDTFTEIELLIDFDESNYEEVITLYTRACKKLMESNEIFFLENQGGKLLVVFETFTRYFVFSFYRFRNHLQ